MSDATKEAERLAIAGVRALDDGVLRVRGEDARSWLNGQITNDVRSTRRGDAVYALVLDGRGKILADAWALDRGDDLLLIVPRETVEPLLVHFEKYIVMEDVELEALDLRVVTVQGARATEIADGYPCDRLGLGGRDVLVEPDARDATVARLAAAAEALGGGEVGEAGWELARLRAGRPRFGADFGAAHYPQEAGLERLAVSFTKGCYLGQEVVCTLENRGQLSRRLVRLEGPVQPGAELRGSEKIVGSVTSAVHDPARGGTLALGYVKRAAATPGARHASDAGEVVVTGRAGGEPASGQAGGGAL